MYLLILGLALFTGVHLLRELRLRDIALDKLGANGYKAAFSLIALGGLILIVWGKSASPFTMIYEPRYELRSITHFAMLPAFILVVAGNLPLSHLRSITLNPMVLGTAVWGAAHLWANGDLASVLLFGTLTLWAIIKFFSLAATRSPQQTRPSLLWDATALIGGFALYSLV
ncbi:MAG: NnrU family protein, partial [Gammaproteobacteria bacterium]|nr:NnrU family protein [Gammaproteobacteria bacterium]